MKLAIMQPTYLPWMGYFDLMDQVDTFIFLDDVQFSKQSWQQKNKIKSSSGELLLTVPVKNKSTKQLIKDVLIDNNQSWQKKHLMSIKSNYSRSRYFKGYISFFEKLYNQKIKNLVELNLKIVLWVKDTLKIKCNIIRTSEMDILASEKMERLISICKKFNCNEYLSPIGSKEYIEKNNLFIKNNIKVSYQNFIHPKYNQLYGDFIPYMSIIDLLFNEGPKSLEIIRKGRANQQ